MEKETLDFNKTPSGNRIHISFFGKRNAGKSSVVNAFTSQNVSIVSETLGTTTDPVKKAMELLPLGPVVIIDTPGIDDSGSLGELRVEKTIQILNRTDIAILVVDGTCGLSHEDAKLIELFRKKGISFVCVFNKSDLKSFKIENYDFPAVAVSAISGEGITLLKETVAHLIKSSENEKKIIGDKLSKNDIVILITPIDSSAPKGRLILPQVQTLRDILDSHCISMVCQVPQLQECLAALSVKPALIVTDSQAFEQVKDMVPPDANLTSFSILFARYKGVLETAVHGARTIYSLNEGDTVLISEGCTHHRQCEDIGTVKLPSWIEKKNGHKLNFEFTGGGDFPSNLSKYSLIVHCGGCMLNQKEMMYRMQSATENNIPFTNYGILIAEINGILERSLNWIKE